DHWNSDVDLHRFGIFLMMWGAGLGAPLAAVISVHLKRIAPDGPYSNLQLIGGAVAVVAILVPTFVWATLIFRPGERSDDLMLALSDFAWIPFVMTTPPALMQCFSIGFAALEDRSEDPIFPRWVGYYNLWTGFLFLPGALVLFFKDGPFAWNG